VAVLYGDIVFKKIFILALLLAGALFAYSDYCLNQADPCFQANCYKVAGSWEYDSSAGAYDCVYDSTVYSDAEAEDAFSTCFDQVEQCEESGDSYTPTTSASSNGMCCGSSFILLGTLFFVGYIKFRN